MSWEIKQKLRYMGRAWKSRFLRDRGEISCLLASLGPGDVALDVGANKGQYTYWMMKAVGKKGMVYAFEPQPMLADYLNYLKGIMKFKQLHIEQIGLSSRPGVLTLVIPAEGQIQSPLATFEEEPREGYVSYQVNVDTLDNFFANRRTPRPIRLIKCDVEGHEFDVLKGAAAILKKDRPDILFECETRHLKNRSMTDIFRFLEELGYAGSFIHGKKVLPLAEFDPALHQVLGKKPYANNFLFIFAPGQRAG